MKEKIYFEGQPCLDCFGSIFIYIGAYDIFCEAFFLPLRIFLNKIFLTYTLYKQKLIPILCLSKRSVLFRA